MIFSNPSSKLSSRPERRDLLFNVVLRQEKQVPPLARWRFAPVGMTGFCGTMREHNYRVYFIASKSRVLYVGMTNNLERCLYEHQHDLIDGFSKQYRCHRLVYFESFDDVHKAIDREKQLKRWNRGKKIFLIERVNPTWEDLSAEWGKPVEPLKQQVPPLAS